MKDLILKQILLSNGIKDTSLALVIMREVNPGKYDTTKFHEDLYSLVEDGSIIELEYTYNATIKYIYFLPDTEFSFTEPKPEVEDEPDEHSPNTIPTSNTVNMDGKVDSDT